MALPFVRPGFVVPLQPNYRLVAPDCNSLAEV